MKKKKKREKSRICNFETILLSPVFIHPKVIPPEEKGVIGERTIPTPAEEVKHSIEGDVAWPINLLYQFSVSLPKLEPLIGQDTFVHGVHHRILLRHVVEAQDVANFVHGDLVGER